MKEAKPDTSSISNTFVLSEAIDIIETLMQYGNIRPVEGVIYPAGTHKKYLDKAAKWLLKNRTRQYK